MPEAQEQLGRIQRRVVRRRAVSVSAANEDSPRRRAPWRIYAQRLAIICLALGLTWVLFFSGWLNVRGISVSKTSTLSKITLDEQLETYLKDRSLQRNILFFQRDAFRQYLRDQNPTFRNVNINRTFFLEIAVRVEESTPAIIWQVGQKQWLVGDDGRVLRQANEKDDRLGKVIDTAQLQFKVGDKACDTEFVLFIKSLYQQAGEKGWQIVQTEIGETTREVIVRLSNGIYIRMATNRQAGDQVRAYEETLATAQTNGKKVNEYVDVRIVGKTFYK